MLRRVLVLLLLFLWAGESRANYTEAHAAGVDARVVVARDGRIVVTHALAYHVLAGTLRSIALSGFEDDLEFHDTATVTSADGHTYGARVSRDDKDIVHVTLDDPKGIKRGDYRFELTYEGTLAGRRITRDGAFDRVRFALPPLHEGIDSARVVFDFPSAPTEPRAAADQNASEDAVTDIATLRRSADRDELELVRPHVAKSEAATFFARVDPKALAALDDPALRAAPPAPAIIASEDARAPISVWILVAMCALALFALAMAKARVTDMRGLVPGPASLRACSAAAFFAAGVRVEIDGRFVLGASLVACALPFLALRTPRAVASIRGPARWIASSPDVFARRATRADLFDATTTRGALVASAITFGVLVVSHFARAAGSAAPYFVAIDAVALAPIFFTGTSRQRPPSAEREALALAPVWRALEPCVPIAPHVRVAGEGEAEETRLLASPPTAMSGVTAIEVGVAWEGRGPWLASFDVLVRVTDGTFASAKMTATFPKKRVLPGRKPDERVFRFEPEGPSSYACAAKVLELAEVLRDRRVVIAETSAHADAERRLPPNRRPVVAEASQGAA
jgi:hypothetical protein